MGLAWAEGLIRDVGDPVRSYLGPILLAPGDGERGGEANAGDLIVVARWIRSDAASDLMAAVLTSLP